MSLCPRCSTLFQKFASKNTLSLAISIAFSLLMFHIFTAYSLIKLKTLRFHISEKYEAILIMLFNDKTYV